MNKRPIAKLRSQRGRPPHFAGRTEELAALNKRLDDLCETGDPSEGMSLVVGVPGVGKTQLALRRSETVAVLNAASCDGEATVNAAIAHGVLALEKGGVGFGIPSFHTHMVRRLEAIGKFEALPAKS